MKHLPLFAFFIFISSLSANAQRWSKEKATDWYAKQDWPRGCNFIPSTAINQLEMWQAQTFDTVTINRELGYAEAIGFNTVRVFLHHLAWQVDSAGFKTRINQYLQIADRHHIKTIFVFFDDCWNATYSAGKQPEPKPGVHNSGWVRDPGALIHKNPKGTYPILQAYIKDILSTFKNDSRILIWDLYNEPGNSHYGIKSLHLLKRVFEWARTIDLTQPITAGVFNSPEHLLYQYQIHHVDVISYHSYGDSAKHARTVKTLQKQGRPLVCTEYMARTRNSTFFNTMPMLKQQKIGALNWGLVAGKTNTKYAWGTPIKDGAEPRVWFHEIFYSDGRPYNVKEVELIKSLTGK